MSGFSPKWLALREPVDHRSRNQELGEQLRRRFAGMAEISVIDLGCGTGSNLRATSQHLGSVQSWTLVDYDPVLLATARERTKAWADAIEVDAGTDDGPLCVTKDGKLITVAFQQADLNRDLAGILGLQTDLVTASAFFDLCSLAFIEKVADQIAACRAAFYTVLTYDGMQTWGPIHPADAALLAAFRAHQLTDKGFGPSAGWAAPVVLAAAFREHKYLIAEGSSPWLLEAGDQSLIADLATGFADAVAETGQVPAADLAGWRSLVRTRAVVGHTDTLALPG